MYNVFNDLGTLTTFFNYHEEKDNGTQVNTTEFCGSYNNVMGQGKLLGGDTGILSNVLIMGDTIVPENAKFDSGILLTDGQFLPMSTF